MSSEEEALYRGKTNHYLGRHLPTLTGLSESIRDQNQSHMIEMISNQNQQN